MTKRTMRVWIIFFLSSVGRSREIALDLSELVDKLVVGVLQDALVLSHECLLLPGARSVDRRR